MTLQEKLDSLPTDGQPFDDRRGPGWHCFCPEDGCVSVAKFPDGHMVAYYEGVLCGFETCNAEELERWMRFVRQYGPYWMVNDDPDEIDRHRRGQLAALGLKVKPE